jgi:hypothetical protein
MWKLAEGYTSDDNTTEAEDEEETAEEAEAKEEMRLIGDAAIRAMVSRWKESKEIDAVEKGRVTYQPESKSECSTRGRSSFLRQ